MAKKQVTTEDLVKAIVEGMQEKKAVDIVSMDLRPLKASVADVFVICQGNSDKQVEAIASSVEEIVRKKLKDKPWHVEGLSRAEWVLMDYINVVVHIFKEEKRIFYGIEELWGDAEIKRYEDVA